MTETPQPPTTPPTSPPPAAPVGPSGTLPTAPGAVASMVCGIIGVVIGCTGLVLGIVALVLRKKAMERIQAQPGQLGGQGYCTAGLVLGIISIIGGAIWAVYLVIFLLAGVFAVSSAPMMQ